MNSNELVEALLNEDNPTVIPPQSGSVGMTVVKMAEKLYNDLINSGVELYGYSFNERTRTATFASGMETSNHEAMISNFKELAAKHGAVFRRSGRRYDTLTMVVGWPV